MRARTRPARGSRCSTPNAKVATLVAAIREAAKLRLATGMRWSVMRAALKLPPVENTVDPWPATLLHARSVDIEIPRAALRWHVQHYVTPLARSISCARSGSWTVPELETMAHADGTQDRADDREGRPARSAQDRAPAVGARIARRDRR